MGGLTPAEQKSVDFAVSLLQEVGPTLRMPRSSGIEMARHTHMRELRIQHQGRPYRVLYAFDPRRAALLLIGGDKTGNNRWCEEYVPVADAIYDPHLRQLGEGERPMARNYKKLQERMDNASRAGKVRRVRDELQGMALDELRNAKRLTQADMAEMLDVPQSSISRIEQRADMYLSTLRNYVHALGGVLQIQAVFPEGGAVAISRFGEYEDRSYVVRVRAERSGTYKLVAQPLDQGPPLSTKALRAPAFKKTLQALHVPESQISAIRKTPEVGSMTEIGVRFAERVFSEADLIAAGFETTSSGLV